MIKQMLLLAMILVIPLWAKLEDKTIELEWLTEDLFDDVRNLNTEMLNDAGISIGKVTDKRRETAVGRFNADPENGKVFTVKAGQDVPTWVLDKFSSTLKTYGVQLSDEGRGAYLINFDIIKFFTLEEGSYQATAILDVRFTRSDGFLLFKRRITGKGSVWGKDYRDENYNEALSEALVNAGRIFLNSVDLYEALAVSGGKSIPSVKMPELTVKPSFTPTESYKKVKAEKIALINSKGLKLGSLNDSRAKKNQIASYTEEIGKADTRLAVVTEDLKPFISGVLKEGITASGVNMNDDAEYTLSGAILHYSVRDKDKYSAKADFLFTLTDSKGTKVWEDVVKGRDRKDGRAWLADEYNTTLSNAMVAAVGKLLNNRSLLKVYETGQPEVAKITVRQFETPLNWEPSNEYEPIAGLESIFMNDYSLKVTMKDSRSEKEFIGQYVGDADIGNYCKVTTSDAVAPWVETYIRSGLQEYGLSVADSGITSHVLSLELLKLFVHEDNTYNGTCTFKATISTLLGNTLWSGVITGSAKTFGSTFMDYNYRQIISESVMDGVMNLLRNEEFRVALGGTNSSVAASVGDNAGSVKVTSSVSVEASGLTTATVAKGSSASAAVAVSGSSASASVSDSESGFSASASATVSENGASVQVSDGEFSGGASVEMSENGFGISIEIPEDM